MLLARRKRQHEAALALRVDGLACKPARHLPDILLARREKADIGAAELQADADALAFAHDDVRAHLARRLDQAERNRLGHHCDQQRARGVRRFGDRRQVGDAPEDVGILHDDCACLAVDRRRSAARRRFRRSSSGSDVWSVSSVNFAIVLATLT